MRHRVSVAVGALLAIGTLGACSSSSGTTSQAAPSTTAAPGPVPVVRSGGCSANAVVPAGETTVDTKSGGVARWYVRHVPPSYTGTSPLPMVIDLHGYQEGARIQASMSRLGAYGDTKGFITLTPEGSGNPVPRWDVGVSTADMRFIGDLLDEAGRTLCIDTNRVYVAGLSNGAFMTSAVACAYSDRVAAVAPVAGITADIANCAPKRPVPVVTFHGTGDQFVTYDGTFGKAALNLPSPDGKGKLGDNPQFMAKMRRKPVPDQLAMWAKRNGCQNASTQTAVASDVTHFVWNCPADASVELYRITGGGHAWPGSAFSKMIAGTVGPTTMSIDADAIMWDFFVAHPLRSRTNG